MPTTSRFRCLVAVVLALAAHFAQRRCHGDGAALVVAPLLRHHRKSVTRTELDQHVLLRGRREILAGAVAAGGGVFSTKVASASATPVLVSANAARQDLLQLLLPLVDVSSDGPRGAPMTSVSLPDSERTKIESAVMRLEATSPYGRNLTSSTKALTDLSGTWRLLYTDAPEITGLANPPLGFQLGPVFQPIDTPSKSFENIALVTQNLGLARGNLRVVGTFKPAAMGSLNAAGVKNVVGNRIDVDFKRLVFTVDDLLGLSTGGRLRKVASPQAKPGAPQPAVDITYLDEALRITRGGDNSIFVLMKEYGGTTRTLSFQERQQLEAEAGEKVVQGDGVISWTSSLGGSAKVASVEV